MNFSTPPHMPRKRFLVSDSPVAEARRAFLNNRDKVWPVTLKAAMLQKHNIQRLGIAFLR